MLDKRRAGMADRDFDYLLTGMVEVDDCMVGGKSRQGQRRRGSENKHPVWMAVSVSDGGIAGFLKAQAVDHTTVKRFGAGIDQAAQLRSDGFRGLSMLGADHELDARATPPEAAQTWLPVMHRTISNLKRYLLWEPFMACPPRSICRNISMSSPSDSIVAGGKDHYNFDWWRWPRPTIPYPTK